MTVRKAELEARKARREKRLAIRALPDEERRAYYREKQAEYRSHRPHPVKPDTLVCRSCMDEKPFTNEFFYSDTKGRWKLERRCKECCSEAATDRKTRKKYGLTQKEYLRLKTKPCAICEETKQIMIDHCHETGAVRDGLCNSCNSGLGIFKDSPDLMRKAADYIEAHRMFG